MTFKSAFLLFAVMHGVACIPAGLYWNPNGSETLGTNLLICAKLGVSTSSEILVGSPCTSKSNLGYFEDMATCLEKAEKWVANSRGSMELGTFSNGAQVEEIPADRAKEFAKGCWYRSAGIGLPAPPPPTDAPDTIAPTESPPTPAPTVENQITARTVIEDTTDSTSTAAATTAVASALLSGSAMHSTQGAKLKQFMKLARCPPDTDSQDMDFLDSPTGMGRARNSGSSSSSLSNRRTMLWGNLMFLAALIAIHFFLACVHYAFFKVFCIRKAAPPPPREQTNSLAFPPCNSIQLSDSVNVPVKTEFSNSCVSNTSTSVKRDLQQRRRGASAVSRASGVSSVTPPKKRHTLGPNSAPSANGMPSSAEDKELAFYRMPSDTSEYDIESEADSPQKKNALTDDFPEASDEVCGTPSMRAGLTGRGKRLDSYANPLGAHPTTPTSPLNEGMFPQDVKRSDNSSNVLNATEIPPSETQVHTLKHSLAVMRFPSFSVFPFLILFQPISTPAFVLLYYVHNVEDIIAAIFGLFVLLVLTILMGRELRTEKFDNECTLVEEEGRGKVCGWLLGTHSWTSKHTDTNSFERRHALIFKDFLHPFRWFLLIDILLLASISAIGAMIPATTNQCAIQAIIMTVLEVCFAVYIGCYCPFLAKLDYWNVLLITILQIVGLGLALVTILIDNTNPEKDRYATLSRGFLLASTVALLLKALFDVIVFIKDRIVSCATRKKDAKDAKKMLPLGKTSSATNTHRSSKDMVGMETPLMVGVNSPDTKELSGSGLIMSPLFLKHSRRLSEHHEVENKEKEACTEPACSPRAPLTKFELEQIEKHDAMAGPGSDRTVTPSSSSCSDESSDLINGFGETTPQIPITSPKPTQRTGLRGRRSQDVQPLSLVGVAASSRPRAESSTPPPRARGSVSFGDDKTPATQTPNGRGQSKEPPPMANFRRYTRSISPQPATPVQATV